MASNLVVEENELNFKAQFINIYNQHLPYGSSLNSEALEYLKKIKSNISLSLFFNEYQSLSWTCELKSYLTLYGFYFPKEDHIFFIKALLKLILVPYLESSTVCSIASVLILLMKKTRLISPKDLTIEWRPLYSLFEKLTFKDRRKQFQTGYSNTIDEPLKNLIELCRIYFPISATQEILDEFRPFLCPFNSYKMYKGTFYLNLFLPTLMAPEHHDQGFKLWFDEIMSMWQNIPNSSLCDFNIFKILSRLASDTIGYIDWTPHIPMIFTYFLRSMELIGSDSSSQAQNISANSLILVNPACIWVVSMIGGPCQDTLDHIEKLFKAIESFYYPSNIGRWNLHLSHILNKLPSCLIYRLHKERYQKPSWKPEIPDNYKIKEEEIDRLVDILNPILFTALFSRIGVNNVAMGLKNLSWLRPEKTIPPLIEKLYSALESTIEAHRLTALITALSAVAPSMINGLNRYEEGKTHLVQLLFACLPGLDFNDIRKCLGTFELIGNLLCSVPILDCSSMTEKRNDLTEVEYNVCLETAKFEDFVLLFLDKVFSLIENTASEHRPEKIDNEPIRLNSDESVIKHSLSTFFSAILSNCLPSLFHRALEKLFNFIRYRIFESKVQAKMICLLCQSFAKVNAEATLAKLVPYFSNIILVLTESDEVLSDENIDGHLLFSLQLIAKIFLCNGKCLLLYKEKVLAILRKSFKLKSKNGYEFAAQLLKNCLNSLTNVYPINSINLNYSWSELTNFSKHNPIQEWSKPVNINNSNLEWHVPSLDEKNFAQELLEEFLFCELSDLKNWRVNGENLNRERVNKSLHIICKCLMGASSALPKWKQPTLSLIQTIIPFVDKRVNQIGVEPIDFLNGQNIRETVALEMRSFLNYILKKNEDDTKALGLIIKIYIILLGWTKSSAFVKVNIDYHRALKQIYQNKLIGKKSYIKRVLVDRVRLQHENRLSNKNLGNFSSLERDMVLDLIQLAVSHYSDVRIKAQTALSNFKRPYGQRLVFPKLIEFLKKKDLTQNEELKGILNILLDHKRTSLFIIPDWPMLNQLWSSLVNASYSEKPTIINLMNKLSKLAVQKFNHPIIHFKTSEELKDIVKNHWNQGIALNVPLPNKEELEKANAKCLQSNDENLSSYSNLILNLVNSIENGDLHWRHSLLAFTFLQILIREDIRFPIEAVKLLVKNLNNDYLTIRQICVNSLGAVLKQIEPKVNFSFLKNLSNISGNDFLMYKTDLNYDDFKIWSSLKFVSKSHFGFYAWPKSGLKFYSESNSLTPKSIQNMEEDEKVIYDFFLDKEKVEKMLNFMALDEKKEGKRFNTKRFYFFKGLFKNFGISFIENFADFFTKLTVDTKESVQKCGTEFLSGLIRGSKHWSYSDMVKLRSYVSPFFEKLFERMTPEIVDNWMNWANYSFIKTDARRFSWLINSLMNDISNLGSESSPIATSFHQASKIHCLTIILQSQSWRSLQLLTKVIGHLLSQNHLKIPYQNIREKLGLLLTQGFHFDVNVTCIPGTLSSIPKIEQIVEKVISTSYFLKQDYHLKNGYSSDCCMDVDLKKDLNETEEQKDALNFLKITCIWLNHHFSRNSSLSHSQYFRLLPILCELQNKTKDENLNQEIRKTLNMMSKIFLKPECIEVALDTCSKVVTSKSWHAKVSISGFLQILISSNLFTLMSNPYWVSRVEKMMITLLEDERVEVRNKAANTLSGLIHYGFIQVNRTLINKFKLKSEKKLTKNLNKNEIAYNPAHLIEKHCGILGLCSIVKAYPYEVPIFLPDVLMILAQHLNDPQPIPGTIKQILLDFKRTHYDNWRDHKLKFNEDQLTVITDLLVSPSYYA